jgi:hypothetical protein
MKQKKAEVPHTQRKLPEKQFYILLPSPNMTSHETNNGMSRIHTACMEEIRDAHNLLNVNFQQKTPLGKSRHKWEDNTKKHLGK